jgi:inner membrane protein
MDPVTHMLVGAAVGQVAAGRSLGFGRAALWGAIAAELPDIDIIVSAATAGDALDRLVSHRGVTHSLWFGPLVGVLAGYLLSRSTDPPRMRPWTWMLLLTAALLSHALLDLCTHYGTQLLSPFSDQRFALPALPIVEPVYSAIFVVGLFCSALFVRRRRPDRAVLSGVLALLVSAGYLLYGLRLNAAAEDWARKDLAASGADVAIVHAFPTLLQLHYRRVVARTPSEDWVGFVSMAHPCPIVWDRRPRADGVVVAALRTSTEGRIFEWFATRLTAAYSDRRRVFLTDLRYGFATDVLRGMWRLEADIGATPDVFASPRFVESPRPAPSAANLLQLLREAYPHSCEGRAGTLDF